MAKELACSQCRTTLAVPWDMLGKWVRCPRCRETFRAEESALLPPLDSTGGKPGDSAHRPGPAERGDNDDASSTVDSTYLRIIKETLDQRERQQSWANVRKGLRIMLTGMYLGAGSFLALTLYNLILILCLDLIGPQMLGHAWIRLPHFFTWIEFTILGGMTVGTITYLGAAVVCLTTRAPRTRSWLAAHLLCTLVFIGLALRLWRDDDFWQLDDHVARQTQILAGVVLAALVFLRVFLKKLMVFLTGRLLPAHSAGSYYVFQLGWLIATTLLIGAAMQRANDFRRALFFNIHPPISELVGWLLLLASIGVGGAVMSLVWTAKLLHKAREMIEPEKLGDEA